MKKGLFRKVSARPRNRNWKQCIGREKPMYHREDDIRSAFARDYNRILHCTAYRRLKRKTQVFFATTNDHICTRIEHVNHVTSVSYTIAKFLGLNTELTNAIAIAHDLGHAPFGHVGETLLRKVVEKHIGESFWHEKNSLRFVDKCETLEDPSGFHRNLNLTYAVRDGIICHCGETDENDIFPRDGFIDLDHMEKPSQYSPFTWEGCVVKIADKIAYLGRDIEDAITLKILTRSQVKELIRIIRRYSGARLRELNNTIVMHKFIIDLCDNSSPHVGIRFSDETLEIMNALKSFNYDSIYHHKRLNNYTKYAELIINSIFETLKDFYRKEDTLQEVKRYTNVYPILVELFSEWLLKYGYLNERDRSYKNDILYDFNSEQDYYQAIIDFIAGMTDGFAIQVFNEITTFF